MGPAGTWKEMTRMRRRAEGDFTGGAAAPRRGRVMIVLIRTSLRLFFRKSPLSLNECERRRTRLPSRSFSRIEVLRGRFDSLLKASDGAELQRGSSGSLMRSATLPESQGYCPRCGISG